VFKLSINILIFFKTNNKRSHNFFFPLTQTSTFSSMYFFYFIIALCIEYKTRTMHTKMESTHI
jgi:hypothetical protein